MAEDTRLTYEALYELVRREKSRDELQKLDAGHMAAALVFLRDIDGRLQGVDSSSMFGQNEHEQLVIQAQNARRLVRELYDRRERKVIELALNKARTGSDLIDTTNLIPQERALFDMLVTSLHAFRQGLLGNVLSLREPERTLSALFTDQPDTAGVPPHLRLSPERTPSHLPAQQSSAAVSKATPEPTEEANPGMRKLKFVSPVDQFVGQELELYGPFQPGDEAELPITVAEVLLAQGTALEAR